MKATVIIPSYNAEKTIRQTLTPLVGNFKVIVVNDGSSDRTMEIATQIGADTVRLDKRKGVAIARNRGAKEATSEILVFVDADVVIGASEVERMVHYLDNHPDVHAVGAIPQDKPNLSNQWSSHVVAYRTAWPYLREPLKECFLSPFQSECGAIRRKCFEAVGGFSSRYTGVGMEEFDLGHRMEKAGYRNVLLPQIRYQQHYKSLLTRTKILRRRVALWVPLLMRRGKLESSGSLGDLSDLFSCFATYILLFSLFMGFGVLGLIISILTEFRFLKYVYRNSGFLMCLWSYLGVQLMHLSVGLGFFSGLMGLIRLPDRNALRNNM